MPCGTSFEPIESDRYRQQRITILWKAGLFGASALITSVLLAPSPAHADCKASPPKGICTPPTDTHSAGEKIPCDPRHASRPTLFPLGRRTLTCTRHRPAPPPAWMCKSLGLLSSGCRKECQAPPKDKSGPSPYAETVLMRRKVPLPLSDSQRKALIAAIIARDPKYSLEITKELRTASNPEIRFGVTLAVAYALAKYDLNDNRDVLARLVADLRKDRKKVSSYPTSDADFLAAILAKAAGERKKAAKYLEAALSREPNFFNAAVLAAHLQIQALTHSQFGPAQKCADDYEILIQHLMRMVRIESCPRMAIHAEIFLARQFRHPEKTAPLLAARVYLAIMAWRADRARQILARFKDIDSPTCKQFVVARLTRFVEFAGRELERK